MLLARAGAAAWRLLTDVRFAVVLITLLALSGLVGIFVRQFPVTQADDPVRYAAELAATRAVWEGIAPLGLPLGPALADLFDTVGLFSVFSSPWFLVLMTVLVISIVCCTIDRTPRLWRTAHDVRVQQPAAFFDPARGQRVELVVSGSPATTLAAVQAAFRARHFRRQRTGDLDGAGYVYADRNQYQKLATLLTHAGLVLFLAGGALTVASGFETIVFVGEGQSAPVRPIGTPDNLLLRVHGFDAPRREDGSFADYATDLSVYRDGSEVARKVIRVNDPLTVDGFVFHQNTFGPTAELVIRDAGRELVWDGPLLLDDELAGRPQGFMTIPGSSVGLVAVLSQGADGAAQLVLQGIGPADEASGENPTLFLATVPLGVATDPEVTGGHSIEWADVGAWTGLVVKNDPGQAVVWLAFGCLISGLVLTFYFPRRRAWARLEGERLGVAFLADPTVDREREFALLVEALQRRLGAAHVTAPTITPSAPRSPATD